MASTPWGPAAVLDEVVLHQRAPDDRTFTTHVQLLEAKSGERLVRLAYATAASDHVRRGPVTLAVEDLTRLREELADHAELAAAFGFEVKPRRRPAGARAPRRRASPG